MFTGIIEHLGTVRQIKRHADSATVIVDMGTLSTDVGIGDSVAINGACLTATQIRNREVCFDVSDETLRKTTIGELRVSDRVNVERSLKIGDKLGGHFVSGHVDGAGVISKKQTVRGYCNLVVSVAEDLTGMMIKKGSVSIDGISLTIVDLEDKLFSVAVVPHTLDATTLGIQKVGQRVNIETDMFGKWVKKILTTPENHSPGITEEMLVEKGYL
ncbi:MAG: riboflavin synthase [Planctomycetes bacterium]|nr:riboflavin synthase [Planctomycetota bacterium]